MGRRKEPRVQLNLQASICGMDSYQKRIFLEPVMVRNISASGVSIQVSRPLANASDVVVLKYGGDKGRFRVVWTGETRDAQWTNLGLQPVLSPPLLWGLEPPAPRPDDYRNPRLHVRRSHRRYSHELPVELRVDNCKTPIWSSTSDLSGAGCFVYMLSVLPNSTSLNVALWIREAKVWAEGRIVSNRSGFGVGIEFIAFAEPARSQLQKLIESSPEVADRRVAPEEGLTLFQLPSVPSNITCFGDGEINS